MMRKEQSTMSEELLQEETQTMADLEEHFDEDRKSVV